MNKILTLLLISSKNGISIKLIVLRHCLIGKSWKNGLKEKHDIIENIF